MTVPHFLLEDYDISFLSAYKTPARARYYYDMTTMDDVMLLPEIYFFAGAAWLPIVIVGGGTNCLFAFDTYEGIFVRNRYVWYSEPYEVGESRYVTVHSGEVTTSFALALYQHYSISTLIPWVGLPGTMGGATIGNAGCFGLETADIFVEAHILDIHTGEMHIYKKSDMHYQYRESQLKWDERYFVVDTTLNVAPLGWAYESYTPADLQALRRLKQPPGFSCGSFFKNPRTTEYREFIGGKEHLTGERGHIELLSAGKLIDEAGLKWYRTGWVHVSERHGNFFINDEKWTWHDVLALRDHVKKAVLEHHGIELHEEIRIISNPL